MVHHSSLRVLIDPRIPPGRSMNRHFETPHVERTFAWLHNRRRLLLRTDRRDDIHESFLALACCLISGNDWKPHSVRTS